LPAEALSIGEKSVLQGLARWPSFDDRRLAEALGARPSTVTAVRSRLEKRCLFRRAYLPSINALGAGVICVSHGIVAPESLAGLKRALGRGLFPADGCDSFLALAAPFGWLEMGAFRDYSGARQRGDGMPRVLEGLPGGAAGPAARSVLPVELVLFHNFFDFAPLLSRHFRPREAVCGPRPVPAAPARRLSPVERLSLYGLVKRPGAADRETAGELGVSRQAVARARRLLVEEGLLIPSVVPDLRRLGLGLLALFHFRFSARAGPEAVNAAVGRILGSVPHFFAISAGAELVVLGAYRDLASFEKETLREPPAAGAAGPLEGAPNVRTLLLDDAVFARDLDFVPFVKAALGLDIAD
jgi:DNA-binding MarR family transcriptional regulator